jgi:hypothetical protein
MFENNFTTLGLTLGTIGKERKHTKFWWGNTFVKHPFEDQEKKREDTNKVDIRWFEISSTL